MQLAVQSRTQSPRASWSAGERPERLWDNRLHFPRKRGFRSYYVCLSLTGNRKEKTRRVESVRETRILSLHTKKMIIGLL